jgi:DNA-binding beta-propeller fold protein YncE
VYFTALTLDGEPGVFKVAASGGAVERLHVGAPLVTPHGIAISDDGNTLVIADASADRDEETDGNGSLFTIATAGGAPQVLAGSEGYRPRGLEIKETEVFFTGIDKDRKTGLFKVGLAGGAPSPVAVGEPFSDPSGVAIRKNGEVYVADSSPIGGAAVGSAVIKVVDGKAEIYKTEIAVGHPAGIALSQDDGALLVSGLSPETGTDLVFRFDLGSGEMKSIDSVIKDFQESAGLHRAKGAEVYAWADSRANKNGTVYVLSN